MRTGMIARMRGGEQDGPVPRHEIGTGCPPHARTDHPGQPVRHVAFIQPGIEDLVTFQLPGRIIRLEGDHPVVEAEICLSIIPSES